MEDLFAPELFATEALVLFQSQPVSFRSLFHLPIGTTIPRNARNAEICRRRPDCPLPPAGAPGSLARSLYDFLGQERDGAGARAQGADRRSSDASRYAG